MRLSKANECVFAAGPAQRTLAGAIVLTLAILVSLTACGGGGTESGGADDADSRVTLTEEPRAWPEQAVEWAEAMNYSVRSLDDAVRVRDEAAVGAWIANLASCSLKMPPDPGDLTLEDVMGPATAAAARGNAINVYDLIATVCRNYELAAEHLAAAFDPANVYSVNAELGIGLQYLHGSEGIMRGVLAELERVWGLSVSDSPGPEADLGQDSEAFDDAAEVGQKLVSDSASDIASGATTQLDILAQCYDERTESAESGADVNPVSWGRGCRAGVEDAIAELARG